MPFFPRIKKCHYNDGKHQEVKKFILVARLDIFLYEGTPTFICESDLHVSNISEQHVCEQLL